MGTENFMNFTNEGTAMKACEGMLIVATPESLADISRAAVPGLVLYPCDNRDPIPVELAASAKVLVVEIDPDQPRSLARLADLGRSHPALPKIAAIANSSIPLVRMLVREGVSDVVSLPFRLDELTEVALSALQAAQAAARANVTQAPLIAVVQSVGGVGTTSVATHLAADLHQQLGGHGTIAIADFDLQSGTVAEYIGSRGSGSISDLLAAGARLDLDLVQSMARPSDAGLAVFAAPATIEPIESVDTDQVIKIIAAMRQLYAGVVMDMPSDITNWSLSAIARADLIVMVVELSVSSLRQAKRRLELFDSVGIERSRIAIVVNRVEKRMFKSIDLGDVADTLQRDVLGSLPIEEKDLKSAQTQGVLVGEVSRKSRFSTDLAAIAKQVHERLPFGRE